MADKDLSRREGGGDVGRAGASEPAYQPLIEERSGLAEAFAPVAGFGVTLANVFKPAVTEQYPFEKVPTQPRYHGRHQLNRYPDGLEKCIGCELCAWACPADAIYVEGADNTPDAQYSPGERYGRVYQINYLRCIFCGLCIEACPTRALTMTNEYELAGPTRRGMIYEKTDLLAPLGEGMLEAPHPMVPGTEDGDYYRGAVSGPVPEQVDWVAQWRPEEPSLESFGVTPSRAEASSSDAAGTSSDDIGEPVEHGQPAEVDPTASSSGAGR